MPSITCTDRYGNAASFTYEERNDYLSDPERLIYKVWSDPPPADQAFFELTLESVDDETLIVVMAANHGRPEYVAKGIPDALLPHISNSLRRTVESSPGSSNSGGRRRSDDATKYWIRLLKAGVAIHDSDRDVYRIERSLWP